MHQTAENDRCLHKLAPFCPRLVYTLQQNIHSCCLVYNRHVSETGRRSPDGCHRTGVIGRQPLNDHAMGRLPEDDGLTRQIYSYPHAAIGRSRAGSISPLAELAGQVCQRLGSGQTDPEGAHIRSHRRRPSGKTPGSAPGGTSDRGLGERANYAQQRCGWEEEFSTDCLLEYLSMC